MVPLSSEASQNFHDWVWKQIVARKTSDNTRSSLIRLARSALDLHESALAKGLPVPRDEEGLSQPLAVVVTALATAVKHSRESSHD
jgi:hypothetical protein